MIHTRMRTPRGEIVRDVPAERLRTVLEEREALVWLDLESPSADEIGLVAGELGWSDLTVEDLTEQGQRAKLEEFEGYAHMVIHDLVYDVANRRLETPEVDFVIGRNYVASVHYHHLEHISEAREIEEHLASILTRGADYLLYVLVDRLVDGYFSPLDDMHAAVEDLEQAIIDKPEPSLLPRIFEMKRAASVLRRVINPQLEVFSRLTSPGMGIVSEKQAPYFRDVHDHLIRIMESIDTYRELMSNALDAYLSNVNNQLSDVMKRLTILTALFLPMTFATGLVGMNLHETPPWDDPIFWLLLAGMASVCAAQWVYFRRKGWI